MPSPIAELGWCLPLGAVQETVVQAKSRSLLVAVLVTSAIALLGAWTGDRASLLGLLIVGPLLAAASLDAQRTAIIGLYALGLALLLGIPDGIFGTTDHLLGCLVVATGGGLGALLAHRRTQRERALLRITRIAEVAQRTILRPSHPGWAGSPWRCATCRPPRTPWSAATSTTLP
jgi:hypothetical protein